MTTEIPADDCFAMPPGVKWLPVDDAINRIISNFVPRDKTEKISLHDAAGRILAEPITALRNNPAMSNSAVDGFGFSFDSLQEKKVLELEGGYVAPGALLGKSVPFGKAIKILTGAPLPSGVDTVQLQEYAQIKSNFPQSNTRLEKGANTRLAGEDIQVGDLLFVKGHKIKTNDLATLIAAGIEKIKVFTKLRVGVLSTGNELVPTGMSPEPTKVFDANRPMILSLIDKLGFIPIDLGLARDIKEEVRSKLNLGSSSSDIILTSGGASSGMEDYVSHLLSKEGELNFWRIAIKPGRPLALAKWHDTYIFGLPGNPIAAFVCTLIFGLPAMRILSGENWIPPVGFMVPSAFRKIKKPGRREYLRAKTNNAGMVEVFASEGSGLTTSLSWSEGLVELGEDTQNINKGDLVKYYPYCSFWG